MKTDRSPRTTQEMRAYSACPTNLVRAKRRPSGFVAYLSKVQSRTGNGWKTSRRAHQWSV